MNAATGTHAAPRTRVPAGSRLAAATGAFARSVPAAAWACALVALLNGIAWSLIVPPFQVPDENAHYAYVAQIAETGKLPRPRALEGPLSPREDELIAALLTFGVAGHTGNPGPTTDLQQRTIEGVEHRRLSPTGDGDVLSATSNPPLYYALEAVPYRLSPGTSVLDRLAAMRLLSALMGAATVLLVFMFVRELLASTPWAWAVGALLVAFQPLFGFMSGGVNNDSLLYLTSAGLFWGLARAFRRGLDTGSGALIGVFAGVGLVSKLTILGLLPAAALALVLLIRGAAASRRSAAIRGAAVALTLAVAPLALYALLNTTVWGRSLIPGGVGSVGSSTGRTFSFREEISHIWQLFLPHLWLNRQFSYYPLWETWFVGFVGRFGWLDYNFPAWVYQAARVVTLAVIAMALVELLRHGAAARRRAGELAVYVLAVLGLCVVIGIESYRYLISNGGVFEQARYLLPLLPLYAALTALAVRVGGRRWGPVLGAALVALAIGHDLYAQAITLQRYYT